MNSEMLLTVFLFGILFCYSVRWDCIGFMFEATEHFFVAVRRMQTKKKIGDNTHESN